MAVLMWRHRTYPGGALSPERRASSTRAWSPAKLVDPFLRRRELVGGDDLHLDGGGVEVAATGGA